MTTESEPRRLSYSQFSTWSQCPRQYKYKYVDRIGGRMGSIHTLFGTAMHETLQHYLLTMYTETKAKANEIDLNRLLMDSMKAEFLKEKTKLLESGETDLTKICGPRDLNEFYRDGLEIIRWFKKSKNLARFYQKRGWKLLGIELSLNLKIRDGIIVVGFIDVIIQNVRSGKITIIDIKTSTNGWSKWQKGSDLKKQQILLYKKWYSQQYDVPIDSISVEFQIVRRKLPKDSEFPIPRMSRFAPAHGRVSMNKAIKAFDAFVDMVFKEDGSFISILDDDYPTKPSKLCDWCDFNGSPCDINSK